MITIAIAGTLLGLRPFCPLKEYSAAYVIASPVNVPDPSYSTLSIAERRQVLVNKYHQSPDIKTTHHREHLWL